MKGSGQKVNCKNTKHISPNITFLTTTKTLEDVHNPGFQGNLINLYTASTAEEENCC